MLPNPFHNPAPWLPAPGWPPAGVPAWPWPGAPAWPGQTLPGWPGLPAPPLPAEAPPPAGGEDPQQPPMGPQRRPDEPEERRAPAPPPAPPPEPPPAPARAPGAAPLLGQTPADVEFGFAVEPSPTSRWPETAAEPLPEAAGIPQVGPLRGGLALSDLLAKRIRGFSDRLLTEHHRIYREYYTKFREVRTKLRTAERGEANEVFSRYRALKVSENIAWNGVRLHELYFDNLGGVGGPAVGRIAEVLKRDFGSFENWVKDFVAAAKATRMWAVTAYDYYDRKLHNWSVTRG